MAEFIDPKVYLIAHTRLDENEVYRYLESIGATNWFTDAGSDAEYLVEIGGRLCFDEETEYLTSDGWKKYDDIIGSELFATLNPKTQLLEYQKPLAYWSYDYDGVLLCANGRHISFAVTPEHRQYCSIRKQKSGIKKYIPVGEGGKYYDDYRFHTTDSLNGKPFKLLSGAKGWIGEYPDSILIPDVEYTQEVSNQFGSYGTSVRKIEGKKLKSRSEIISLAKLMVYYATEGHIHNQPGSGSGITISGDHEDGVAHCCDIIGLPYSTHLDPRNGVKHIIVGGGLPVASYFEQECGKYSQNKKLPRWIANLPSRGLECIWDLLVETDGHYTNGRGMLTSTSIHLIDFAQEILSKLGFSSSVVERPGVNYPCHVVAKKLPAPIGINLSNGPSIERVEYRGKVHCVTTKNGIVLVRRNNHIHFSGNCYASWEPGINKNVTRVRQGNQPYIENIIKSKHGSVLEHASCTFIFQNVTRVFCAELCRHRAGCAISEASLRYIRLDNIKAFEPHVLESIVGPEYYNYFIDKLKLMESWQVEMAEMFDLDNKSFDEKKQITSAMRRLAPLGLATNIMWTANMRTLRHVLELRTSIHAEEEIRNIFDHVGFILQRNYPILFGDFTRNEHGEWITEHSKI